MTGDGHRKIQQFNEVLPLILIGNFTNCCAAFAHSLVTVLVGDSMKAWARSGANTGVSRLPGVGPGVENMLNSQ